LVGGEALRRELRVHERAVDRNLECAALRLDELDLGIGESALDLGGQTDRLRQVVSLDAVLDRDLHRRASIFARQRRGRNGLREGYRKCQLLRGVGDA
jgi:hypothetical protein